MLYIKTNDKIIRIPIRLNFPLELLYFSLLVFVYLCRVLILCIHNYFYQ